MQALPDASADAAYFFDFDGTLVDIAARPDAVRLAPAVAQALVALQRQCGGALAVVSGRPVAQIDNHLGDLLLPAAGVHGGERRDAQGQWTRVPTPDLAPALARLEAFVAEHDGLRLEPKAGAVALHYRGADALASLCLAKMQAVAKDVPGLALLRGKKVFELKPAGVDKGRAVQAFMQQAPFAGRRPWYFGDDVTDEAAFEVVRAMGGVTVKIGDVDRMDASDDTAAEWHLPSPAALRAWLLKAAGMEQTA